MPMFSKASLRQLRTCHPELQTLMFEVIKYVDCTIIEGYRDEQDQNAAFEKGYTKLQFPNGNHNHNPSLAVDVMPDPIDYKNTLQIYHFAGFVMGVAKMLQASGKMTHSIRWGGNWNASEDFKMPNFFDGAHFELIV